jgi:hypothetical protein
MAKGVASPLPIADRVVRPVQALGGFLDRDGGVPEVCGTTLRIAGGLGCWHAGGVSTEIALPTSVAGVADALLLTPLG